MDKMHGSMSSSRHSFGISDGGRAAMRRKEKRYLVVFIAGILSAILAGFLLGYFLPKCSDDRDEGTNKPNTNYDQTAKLLSTLDSKSIEEISRSFSSSPHLAASPRDNEMATEIAKRWKEYGFKVELPTYEVLLSFPKENTANKVELLNQTGHAVFETHVSRDGDGVPAFLAYAAAGTAEGHLVYVNYGTHEDFLELERRNISLNGTIAIIRYGKIFRGSKVAMAASRGAVGVILYSDPADYAPYDSYYPSSWWLPPNATQRGSVYPGPSFGDPLTHGLPSRPGIYREAREDANLPKIPVHVIKYEEAEEFLGKMAGIEVPSEWRGGLNISYRFGGFNSSIYKAKLHVYTENVLKNITNVIGTVNGTVEPDQVVLIGSHRDAWGYGAVDSITGTSVVMELARVVGVLLKSGWRPRRTMKFCSWSGEEQALIGSTEYVEENYKYLASHAVAYLNLDLAVCGNYTPLVYSSPLLDDLILDALRNITDPNDATRSLYDVMSERNHATGGEKPRILSLATFSDYASFYQYLAIPSIDWGYYYIDKQRKGSPYPVYHALADVSDWFKFIDPQYKIHLTIAKLGGVFLLNLADKPLLPMTSISDYSVILRSSFQVLDTSKTRALLRSKNISLQFLRNAIDTFEKAALTFEEHLKMFQFETDLNKLRILNSQMRQVEKSFLYPDGLPGRREFKHLVFAPSLTNIYASARFPGITDALVVCEGSPSSECKNLAFQISLLTHTIQQAASLMTPIL